MPAYCCGGRICDESEAGAEGKGEALEKVGNETGAGGGGMMGARPLTLDKTAIIAIVVPIALCWSEATSNYLLAAVLHYGAMPVVALAWGLSCGLCVAPLAGAVFRLMVFPVELVVCSAFLYGWMGNPLSSDWGFYLVGLCLVAALAMAAARASSSFTDGRVIYLAQTAFVLLPSLLAWSWLRVWGISLEVYVMMTLVCYPVASALAGFVCARSGAPVRESAICFVILTLEVAASFVLVFGRDPEVIRDMFFLEVIIGDMIALSPYLATLVLIGLAAHAVTLRLMRRFMRS